MVGIKTTKLHYEHENTQKNWGSRYNTYSSATQMEIRKLCSTDEGRQLD